MSEWITLGVILAAIPAIIWLARWVRQVQESRRQYGIYYWSWQYKFDRWRSRPRPPSRKQLAETARNECLRLVVDADVNRRLATVDAGDSGWSTSFLARDAQPRTVEELMGLLSRFLHTRYRAPCISERFSVTPLGKTLMVSHGVTHMDNSSGTGLGQVYITRVGQDDFRACFALYSTIVDLGSIDATLNG